MPDDGYIATSRPTAAGSSLPWLAVLVLALVLVGLSFVPGWLVHHRELTGEGYRSLFIGLTAWQLRSGSLPVLGGGIAGAVVVAVAGLVLPAVRARLVVGAAVVLGLLGSGLAPLSQVGHVSRLWIGPGWVLGLGIVIAATMAAVTLRAARPGRRTLALAAAALVAALVVGFGVRTLQLHLVEGPRTHWSDGTWERVDGTPGELVLDRGTFRLNDWSGSMEPAGINVILTEDPACPGARGFYRVRAVDAGVLWERVVDICADGARAAELEGVWQLRR